MKNPKKIKQNMCARKTKYNLQGALKMAARQKQSIYRCPYCHDYHLTTKQTNFKIEE